jgi:biopolymer transport protein ExbD
MAGAQPASEETISEINIVPLVDIILVVLIIFMVTAPTVMHSVMPVDLPSAGSSDQAQVTELNVDISSDGLVYFNSQEVDANQIGKLVAVELEKNPEAQAIISADRFVDHGRVIEVLDWLKSSGVKSFAVSTDN